MSRSLCPLVKWLPIDGVSYNGMAIFRHPVNGEIACDNGEYLLDVPAHVVRAINEGVRGQLR